MTSPSTPFINSGVRNLLAPLIGAEMRRAEEMTYAKGVTSFGLMQRAGEAVAAAVREKWKPCRVLVLCGPGNNGGDGFVAAECLQQAGWDVMVASLPRDAEKGSLGDAAQAEKNWRGKTLPLEEAPFDKVDLVIDALFGTGLTRPLEGAAKAAVEKLVKTRIPVVAVDVPSGVNGDTGEVPGVAPQAVLTVTFFRKKIGHLLLPGAKLAGEIIVADIGIDCDVLDQIKPNTCENAAGLWLDQFPFPQPDGHKYSRGHALIYGGAVMTGAARLGARAAQRIGAGLITVAAPEKAIPIYSQDLASVIVRASGTLAAWQELLLDAKRNAVLIGPGLGLGKAEADFVLAALETKKSCVLDADALSNFADRPDALFAKLHALCVLTPHEGEFARLFGTHEENKLSRAREAASVAGCVVLLKGADTVIANPQGQAVINVNAPPWLATAGAGDVLAGMILGLLAQGMQPFSAAAAATWIHGNIAMHFGPGLIAEDLLDGLPAALKGLSDRGKSV